MPQPTHVLVVTSPGCHFWDDTLNVLDASTLSGTGDRGLDRAIQSELPTTGSQTVEMFVPSRPLLSEFDAAVES